MNALLDALGAGDENRARELAGACPDLLRHRDAEGFLPATRALYLRGRDVAEAFLPSESDLNACEAAAFGRLERLSALLDADASAIDRLSPDGFTPLHLACFSGGAETTRLLVERGAGLETLARSTLAQVRPLGTAAFSGDVASARVLLEAGADPNGTEAGGFTPLDAARQKDNEELERLLLEFGADPATAGARLRRSKRSRRATSSPERGPAPSRRARGSRPGSG